MLSQSRQQSPKKNNPRLHLPSARPSRDRLPFGQFGENLTVTGLREGAVRVGDVFRAGDALEPVESASDPLTIAEFIEIFLAEPHDPAQRWRLLNAKDLGESSRARLRRKLEVAAQVDAVPTAGVREDEQFTVTFTGSGVTGRWDPSMDSIFAFAEARGLNPDFSCRTGRCQTCECTLVAGEVEYITAPLDPPEPGRVVICCSRPKTDVVIDL